MIQPNRVVKRPIIYIMLNRGLNSSPTLPPTLFFSVNDPMHPLCPPKF